MADKQSKPKAKSKVKQSTAKKKSSESNFTQQLQELNDNLKQEKDKYLRLFAEF